MNVCYVRPVILMMQTMDLTTCAAANGQKRERIRLHETCMRETVCLCAKAMTIMSLAREAGMQISIFDS